MHGPNVITAMQQFDKLQQVFNMYMLDFLKISEYKS